MPSPNAIIHIRSYKPLSLTMPSPGLYIGWVRLVLPADDPTLLSRLNEGGAGHTCVDFNLEKPVSANAILQWITANMAELEAITRGVASPILPQFLKHLQRGTSSTRAKLGDIDNPLERPQNGKIQGS